MSGRGSETLMTALGFSRETGRLYERVLPLGGRSLTEIAEVLTTAPDRLLRDLRPLLDVGVARVADGVLLVQAPPDALATLLSNTAAGAAQAHARLLEIAHALPYLAGSAVKVPPTQIRDEQPLDGELVSGASMPETLEALVGRTAGELIMLRPDQWSLPWDERVLSLVSDAIANGRRCRAIYPMRVLTEGPVALAARAEAGEEIRLLPDVPTRLLIIGATHVVLP
ncbi:MAG: DNA-binding response regulator, partial [Nocardioides sp.]|nr:DNA-binding response regulator [Nocardioides sp.]